MDLAEILALDIALDGIARMKGGFSPREVAEVEAFWAQVEPELSGYGFVMRLEDKRRFYVELTVDSAPRQTEAEVRLFDLGPEAPPEISASWSDKVEPLNLRLAQLRLH